MSTSRKITVYATKGQQMKVIESPSAIWSELESELKREGYDMSSLHATESINRTDLVNANAVLPTGEFTVFLRPKKTKSGAKDYNSMSFKELRAEVNSQAIKDHLTAIAKKSGRNWTQLSTPELQSGLIAFHGGKATKSTPVAKKTTPTKKVAKKAPAKASSKKATPVRKTTSSGSCTNGSSLQDISNLVASNIEMDSSQKSRLNQLISQISCELHGESEEQKKQAEEDAKKAKLQAEADDLMRGF